MLLFFGVGAYTSAILSSKLGVSPWLGLIAACAAAGMIAFVIGWGCLRLKGYYLGMATLGFGVIVQIVLVQFVSLTGGPQGISGIPAFSLFGFNLDGDLRYYYFVSMLLFLILLLSFNIVDSKVGRTYRAIGNDEIAAESLGINAFFYKMQIFVIAGGLAGLAGSVYAHYITFVSPGSFGFLFSTELVVMMVVGGEGSNWGAVVGAIVLTILPEVLRAYKDFDVMIYGVILMVFVIFWPGGLVGIFRSIAARGLRWKGRVARYGEAG